MTRINPWPDATKEWAAQNPQRVPQLLWSNPRYVFFREEALNEVDAATGPRGAQGVPLTAGRSIAVDREQHPLRHAGLARLAGPAVRCRLVVAQDTGKAITGAVRADYFAGTGAEAGRLAARVNQPLRLWALWPNEQLEAADPCRAAASALKAHDCDKQPADQSLSAERQAQVGKRHHQGHGVERGRSRRCDVRG